MPNKKERSYIQIWRMPDPASAMLGYMAALLEWGQIDHPDYEDADFLAELACLVATQH